MPKMIQVRNVPDRLHRELMRRAKARGQTLTAYVQEVLELEVARSSREDVIRRLTWICRSTARALPWSPQTSDWLGRSGPGRRSKSSLSDGPGG